LFKSEWMRKPWAFKRIVNGGILKIKGLFRHCYALYFPHTEFIQRDLLRAVQCCVCFVRQCGAMFTCLVPFTIMCYLHLFPWNALNANGFSIKISRGEIYMIYCIAAMPRKHDEIQIFQCMAWFLNKGKNGPHQQVSFQKLHSLSVIY